MSLDTFFVVLSVLGRPGCWFQKNLRYSADILPDPLLSGVVGSLTHLANGVLIV